MNTNQNSPANRGNLNVGFVRVAVIIGEPTGEEFFGFWRWAELCQPRGPGRKEWFPANGKALEFGEPAEFGWYRPRQLIAI